MSALPLTIVAALAVLAPLYHGPVELADGIPTEDAP